MPRYVCIHGHFYQPPRENPWLETVELQESAAPWHDWNARIAAECYSRNAASRILNGSGKIVKICNNYSRMSFNLGPTLLSWLQENDPLCYDAILEADAIGARRFSGHGTAMAQVYNHVIMPLANRRDKETQVLWGIADFEKRFRRRPEGMWLAEAAVDTETLEVLAENGILFTVLSPYQADSVRPCGGGVWQDAKGGRIDTTRPYRCSLPSGRSIALFFYDGLLSQKIAFGGMLDNGEHFARQLIEAHPDRGFPLLSHVATDGESYGHHHDHGDMALAYCLETVDRSRDATLTVYGEYLAFYPPDWEVRIIENSSWSCAHGVERWRSDCGCSTGTPGFHQRWRAPLRRAMDMLRDELIAPFEREAGKLLKDPWEARNRYIDLILDRAPERVEAWLKQNASRPLTDEERVRAISLLEMQRAALLMFTSCGWFFDEVSRIEPVQVMRYAAHAMELADRFLGRDLEPAFLDILSEAPSNVPELKNGAKVYELLVKQGRVDMPQLAAYYGITSLLQGFRQSFREGCWNLAGSTLILRDGSEDASAFSAGTVRVTSRITGESGAFLFAANHRGGISLLCGVTPEKEMRPVSNQEALELRRLFAPAMERPMVDRFGYTLYSLRHIPADAQRRLLDELLKQDVQRIEAVVRSIVQNYDQLLEYMTTLEVRPPEIIASAAKIVMSASLLDLLRQDLPDFEALSRILSLSVQRQIALRSDRLCFAVSEWLKTRMMRLCGNPLDLQQVQAATDLVRTFQEGFQWRLSLYDAQNLYHEMLRRWRTELCAAPADLGEAIFALGRQLQFSEEFLKGS